MIKAGEGGPGMGQQIVNLDEIKRKKVRVVRWRTKKIAEFELETN